jgi:uncharacterized protein involved in exopolysaccharide biosynthesis
VIAARNNLDELKARREAEIESLRRGDAEAVAVSGISNNPVYQSIQLQLNDVDVKIAALRGQLQQHRARAAELRQRQESAPQVEAQLAALTRDYDTDKAQYEALLASYEKARLGEEADTAGSVRFEIVQPPAAPYAPTSPRRSMLLVVVLLGAFAAGGALAYALHMLQPVVGSLRGLTSLTSNPVIGVVSSAFPEQLGARARRQLLGFLCASGALVALFAVAVLLSTAGFRLGAAATSGVAG